MTDRAFPIGVDEAFSQAIEHEASVMAGWLGSPCRTRMADLGSHCCCLGQSRSVTGWLWAARHRRQETGGRRTPSPGNGPLGPGTVGSPARAARSRSSRRPPARPLPRSAARLSCRPASSCKREQHVRAWRRAAPLSGLYGHGAIVAFRARSRIRSSAETPRFSRLATRRRRAWCHCGGVRGWRQRAPGRQRATRGRTRPPWTGGRVRGTTV